MAELTSRERIERTLKRQPVDRIGVHEGFWGDTLRKWRDEGHLGQDEDPADHFRFDLRCQWCFNLVADLDFQDEVIEETDETRLTLNGNGAMLRWWKDKSGTPEHVDFTVKDRAGWARHIRPHLVDRDGFGRRIDFEAYRRTKQQCARQETFFCWGGINVFECMHPVCGHEYMLMGMALDPDWVRDMCDVYADLTIQLMEMLFDEEGKPDGVFFFEDLGFKARPFMSPAMYKQIIWPAHKRTFEYCHSLGLPVIVHSCGYVEALLEGLIEAGMDCLQAMEVKAGMDPVRIKKLYGDRIALFGGLDIRTLETNDPGAVEAMLREKLPALMAGGGYILHTDHSIPASVEYQTYRHFVERGLAIGTY